MSVLDYLLLSAVAACAYLAIRTYRRSGGACRCGSSSGGCSRVPCGNGCAGNRSGCPSCCRDDRSTT